MGSMLLIRLIWSWCGLL